MSTTIIGLKLGTTTTCIYKEGNGIVLKEPSLIAMPSNLKIKDVKAVGVEAKKMIGRTEQNITIFSPIANGVVAYEELAVFMLRSFIKKVFPVKKFKEHIKAVVAVPIGITTEEKRQFEMVCFRSGIDEVFLVPDILCYAVGSGIDLSSETAKMLVNIGGDSTNIAITLNNLIINGLNVGIGGNQITTAIVKYIEHKYNLFITNEQAETIKIQICSLIENYDDSIEILGINKDSLVNESIFVFSSEFYSIIKLYYSKIAKAINSMISASNPEIISDINANGIYFYGNSSFVIGLENFMEKETNFKINVSNIEKTNILGLGELIKNQQLLKKILKSN